MIYLDLQNARKRQPNIPNEREREREREREFRPSGKIREPILPRLSYSGMLGLYVGHFGGPGIPQSNSYIPEWGWGRGPSLMRPVQEDYSAYADLCLMYWEPTPPLAFTPLALDTGLVFGH